MRALLESLRKNPRFILSGLLAIAVLVAVVLATGGGIFGSGSSGPSTSSQGPGPTATAPSSRDVVQGRVSVSVKHLQATLWLFAYTIADTGKTPIGGFQINGPRANVFGATGRPGWAVFGGGVCKGNYPNMLVYWSTGSNIATEIKPGQTVAFHYEVNTTGTIKRLYSLSWDGATAQFGQIDGPAPSSLPPSGPCKAKL
jgi:hypothetical protein